MAKAKYIPLVAVISALCLTCGCSQAASPASDASGQSASSTAQTTAAAEDTDAVKLVSSIATTQYITDEPVDSGDMETILTAGINTPSAMNQQPWHFSAITDTAVLQQISEDMRSGMGIGAPPEGADMPDGAPDGFALPEGFDADTAPSGAEMPEGELPEEVELPEDFDIAEGGGPAGGMGAAVGGVSKAGIADAPLVIAISCKEGSELNAGLACQNMSVTAQLLGYGTKIISSPTIAVNGEKQADYRELLGIPEDQTAVAFLLIGMEDTSIEESIEGYAGATTRNPLDEMVTYIAG